MQCDDTRQRVKAILAGEWHVPPERIPDDVALNSVSYWDSLGHITILLALQKEFGIEITPETVQELISLPKIIAAVEALPVSA